MAIEITWLGHSCFRIKGKGATVITDPYGEEIGYSLGKPKANIVACSHAHPGHSNISGVEGSYRVVNGPGEYEIANVLITGMATYHDSEKGAERGKNTIFLFDMEDVLLLHLGDLGHMLDAAQLEQVSDVGVLMVPVGGVSTIDAVAAAEMVRRIEPRIVIPMHYQTEALKFHLDPLERFLKEMGIKADVPVQPKLSVTKTNLPQETQVALLDYKVAA